MQTICQSWQPNCQPWKLTTSISAILEAKLSLSAARLDNCKSWKFEVVALALLGFHMSACYRTASVCVLGFHMSACCAFRHPEAISLCSRARRFSGFGAAAALQFLAEGGWGEGSHIGCLCSRTLWRRCGSFRFPWQLATGFVNVVAVAFLDDSTRNVEESLDVLLKV